MAHLLFLGFQPKATHPSRKGIEVLPQSKSGIAPVGSFRNIILPHSEIITIGPNLI
jgi:hypothetical protein